MLKNIFHFYTFTYLIKKNVLDETNRTDTLTFVIIYHFSNWLIRRLIKPYVGTLVKTFCQQQ